MKKLYMFKTIIAVFLLWVLPVSTIYASEVNVAVVDVTIPINSVTLAPGASGAITINMTVSGKQDGTATFKVYSDWTLSGGTFTGSNPQTFTVIPRAALDPATTFSTTGSVTVVSGQGAGTFTLAVSAFDITNTNTTGAKLTDGTDSNYQVTVSAPSDTTAPTGSITINSDATYANSTSVILNLSATDAVGVTGYRIINGTNASLPGATTYSVTSTTSYIDNISWTILTGDGTKTVAIQYRDVAGNWSDNYTDSIILDQNPPSITAPADVIIEGNTTGGANITALDLGSPTVTDIVDPSPTVTNDAPSFFPLGSHTVTWTATDASGNTAIATQNVTVVDTTPPSITAPADVTIEGNTTGGANITASDLGSPTVTDIVDPSPTVTNDAPSSFPLGSHTVTWTATDASGNTAIATQNVTVVDTTPPVITVAPSISTTVGAPKSILPIPTVTDIVDPNPTVTNDAPNFFPLGTTIVTWTATDASGNTAIATTTVTATYVFSGILQPINVDNSSVLKLGSTIPVKFQLKDYNGNFVTDAVAKIFVMKVSNGPTGTEIEAVSTSAATSGNLFRYDLSSNQYIFNLATKGLSIGTWQIKINLNDGTLNTVLISLR